MMRFFAKVIWKISEFFGINLGFFAPIIFGLMIGHKGVKIGSKNL